MVDVMNDVSGEIDGFELHNSSLTLQALEKYFDHFQQETTNIYIHTS